MAIKKKEDVTPQAEETVFGGSSAHEDEISFVVEEETKEEEPSFSLSAVQKMMKDAEERMMNMFNSQINKLKLNKDKEALDEDLDYVNELQDDWLENPVVFFAFSYQFSIHGDRRRGMEEIPPHGAIKFKPVIRTKRKKGKRRKRKKGKRRKRKKRKRKKRKRRKRKKRKRTT